MATWQEESKARAQRIDAAIASVGLTMQCTFVPMSRAPGRTFDHQNGKGLNWDCVISTGNGRNPLRVPYWQGIGHIPGYDPKVARTTDGAALIDDACETGRYLDTKPLPAPLLRDVLHSVLLDADAIDAGSFEEWASDCGMDPDSRKAEKVYQACLAYGLAMRRMIGDAAMVTLRAEFQDY